MCVRVRIRLCNCCKLLTQSNHFTVPKREADCVNLQYHTCRPKLYFNTRGWGGGGRGWSPLEKLEHCA